MSIRIDSVLDIHARALELRAQRSEILAANLANEATPGFKARDLDFAAEMRRLQGGSAFGAELVPKKLYRVPSQPSQDGNTVELSVEQAQFSRNAMDFETSLSFLSMQVRSLKQAIEGR